MPEQNEAAAPEEQSYDVHVFVVVRSKVSGVRATSPEEATDKAQDAAVQQLEEKLRGSEVMEVAEGMQPHSFLVDVVGDAEYSQSRWLCSDGRTVYDDRCPDCCQPLPKPQALGEGQ